MAAVRVRPLECGWLTAGGETMAEGGDGRVRMPVGAFLIEHPGGVAVFDTGMHPDLEHSKESLGQVGPMFDVELDQHWTLAGQLEALGVAPDDVDLAVVSHLHFDHGGGLGQLPAARLLVQRDEWAGAFDEGLVEFGVYNPAEFDLGHERQLLDGDHDLFGDGSVRVVPTPGHTAGHQSLLVEDRILLVGDACYTQHALDSDVLPPFGHDRDRQREVYGWLREQQAGGIGLVFSHDPDQWATHGPTL
jgi:N-acyl homoserine lactone hydrolase